MNVLRTGRAAVPILGLLTIAVLPLSSSAHAACFISTANTLVFGYLSSNAYDCLTLKTHDGDVTNFNGDNGSPNWMSGVWGNWQSVSMTAPGPAQVSATFKGTQEYDFTTPKAQSATIRDFSLTNVNLNPDNVQLRFQAQTGETSLSLDSSNIDFDNSPSFYAPVHFNLNANAGTSKLSYWQGQVGSTSTINVAASSSLEFFRSGTTGSSVPLASRLYFSQPGNLANVNGGTLIINESNLRFTSDTTTDGFAVRSGGTLEMKGFASRLETEQITVADSTAKLGDNTQVAAKVASFQNATISTGSGATFTADAVNVAGVSTVKTTNYNSISGLSTGLVKLADSATTLNLTGSGLVELQDQVYFNHGAINVKDTATVLFSTATGNTDLVQGTFTVDQGAGVVIKDGHSVTQSASMTFTNNGNVSVSNGEYYAGGYSTIGGAGSIDVDADGVLALDTNGKGSLATTNTLALNDFSTTRLTIDPLDLSSDLVDVQNDLLIDPLGLANLDLLVKGDAVLTDGTKFVLFDSANRQGLHHFAGLANGAVFGLGLNAYEIIYDDSWYTGPGYAITLTVVPEPSTYLLFGLGFLGLAGVRALRGRSGVACTHLAA